MVIYFATVKQTELFVQLTRENITLLVGELDHNPSVTEEEREVMKATYRHQWDRDVILEVAEPLTRRQMSDKIDSLIRNAKLLKKIKAEREAKAKPAMVKVPGLNIAVPAAPAADPVNLEGMHKVGDKIFKVQKAVHGSGRLYAKALLQDLSGTWYFEYAPGAMRNLSAATKMSLEEAKSFGALYGTCCVCGRTLTKEESIEAGIGPICAGKF